MRVWLLSDIHIGLKNNNLDWLHACEDYFSQFFYPNIHRLEGYDDTLIVCGDVFENRQTIGLLSQKLAMDIFTDLGELFKGGVYVLCGNHDILYKNSNTVTSLECLKHIPNVNVIQEPQMLNIGKHRLLLMPWSANAKAEKETLASFADEKPEYCFCHTEIMGAKNNRSTRVNKGANDIDDFGGIKHTYSGHIHYRQEMKGITFLGSPFSTTRNDKDNIKGFYILDLDKGEHTFIENTFSPKFVEYKLDDIADLTVEECHKLFNNNIVDVNVTPEQIKGCVFERFLDLLKSDTRSLNINMVGDSDFSFDGTLEYEGSQMKDLMEYIVDYVTILGESKGWSEKLTAKITNTSKSLIDKIKDKMKYSINTME